MDVAAAIMEQLGIYQVLIAYHIQFTGGGEPEQIHCPFHGADINKSARVYPETDTVYCFTCDKKWNVISFVQEQEELTFVEALRFIRTHWNITISMPDYEASFYSMRRKPLSDKNEFATTVEKLFIAFADSLTAGELYPILEPYNACLAAKDDLVVKDSFTTSELEQWYEESKMKLQEEIFHG
jgi:DNA primase